MITNLNIIAIQEEHICHVGIGVLISTEMDNFLSSPVTLLVHNGKVYASGATTLMDIAGATYVLDQRCTLTDLQAFWEQKQTALSNSNVVESKQDNVLVSNESQMASFTSPNH